VKKGVAKGEIARRHRPEVLADLLLGNRSDLTSVFFVNRRTLPWPPEPLRRIVSRALLGWFHAEDRWTDRNPSRTKG